MARTLQPDSRISHYRIVGPLGTGGMGEVYLAKDETLERNVALKILPPELVRSEDRVRRFMLEAKSASSLNHPHIVTIYEVGRDVVRAADGSEDGATAAEVHFIAMELITGRTFKDLVHSDRIDLRTLIGYLAQAAEGLSKAHAAGIVHRDLKPGNIMVTSDGYAKVLDFGLAKLTERAPGEPGATSAPTEVADRTSAGAILGTVGYMSPEQVRGKGVDHRSDVFSFGCILYEAATRRRPFEAESDIDTMHRILHDAPTPIDQIDPTVPAELRRVIRRCIAKSADQRLQSMKDLAIELREIADEYDALSASTTSATMVGAAPPALRRRASKARIAVWSAAILAVIALGLFALTAGWLGGGAAAPPFASIRMTSMLSLPALQAAMMSPDGRYLAYITGAAGSHRLRVRQIATGSDLDVLPSALEFVRSPSFSPDGTYIFYLQRDPNAPNYAALFDVPSLGGTPRKRIFDVDSGVSFDPDGRQIAFVRGIPQSQKASLMLADLGTGQERTLVTVERPEVLSTFVRPAWSPDGRTIVAAMQQIGGGVYAGLAAFDVTDGARRDISTGALRFVFIDSVAWLPDGRALVTSGAALDSLSQEIRYISYPDGANRPITSDLNQYGSLSVESASGSLAAIRATGAGDLWVAATDGSTPARQITFESSKGIGTTVAMQDGTFVFVANEERYRRLWSMRDDGSQIRAITAGANYVVDPALPYKDTGVAFTLYSGDPLIGHVHRVDRDGGNLTRLTDGPGEQLIDISPDGSTVLYARIDTPNAIWTLSNGGKGEGRKLLEGAQGGAQFSPDGRQILYPVFRERDGRIQTIWRVVPSGGGEAVAEVAVEGPSFGWAWTPDGSLTYGRTIDGVGNLWKQPLPRGEPSQVTRFAEGRIESYWWSRDGKRILLVRRLGLESLIQIVPAEGGEAKTLTSFRSGDIQRLLLSPDGKSAFFVQGEQRTDVVQIRDTQGEAGGP